MNNTPIKTEHDRYTKIDKLSKSLGNTSREALLALACDRLTLHKRLKEKMYKLIEEIEALATAGVPCIHIPSDRMKKCVHCGLMIGTK